MHRIDILRDVEAIQGRREKGSSSIAMEGQFTGTETLLNMRVSQPQHPYQNLMAILKAAARIRLLHVGGMNMWECVNVFSWLDRHFSLLPKPCCVCERQIPFSQCFYKHPEAAVGARWKPTLFWKIRPSLGKKPPNTVNPCVGNHSSGVWISVI